MKNIVIAAGYATRLGELTKNFPKPLLKIGENTILERMLDDIDRIPEIDEHIIITNHKFASIFEDWKKDLHYSKPITIVDDGTETNDTRLGAVCDLLFAMDKLHIDDDLLVVAADNLLFFSFQEFVDFAREKGTSCIMCHEQPSIEKLQRTGVVELDENYRVLGMEEKPQVPKSHWAVPPFYIYQKKDLDLVRHSVENGCGKDAPGNLAHYMVEHTTMHAWPMSAGRFDIGSLDTYYEACELAKQGKINIIMEKIELNNKTIFVTGAAGFIGSNLVKRLFKDVKGATIIGIDNMNDYYDVALKEYRLNELNTAVTEGSTWKFVKGDIADKQTIDSIFEEYKPQLVVNLAAQAGVRYSITNPDAYIQSNMIGFYNILEACRHNPVEHLVYASSSSVYGGNKKVPFSTDDRVDNPVSLYAATKKSNELFAHCYSKLYDIPTTGLRFFTVYGPAGRPDMAYFGFTNKLLKGETIQIFNYGNCRRDFTYVDDIVEGVYRVMQGAPERKKGEDGLPIPPYAVYNIGGGQPENLLDFVQILQEELVRAGVLPADFDFEAHKELVAMQPGDVPTTYADATALERDFGFTPKITLREGLRAFAQWYKAFYCK
ncbi:Nucleoside-diphosphate-sugar epimerase [Xylanibacter ruminicola]|uniref:Nucleoside-diphosphate-sugar epimerase n=1 Tax=Xylanibacter ruminicola TaxID=839 RepID=A0A1H4DIW7_XYLRU|nr:Nucleoside-diphosphate-sugar epimerase [Xylanibacter ruminicola]